MLPLWNARSKVKGLNDKIGLEKESQLKSRLLKVERPLSLMMLLSTNVSA
ncbi:hypothetical protein Sjap_004922 [Stephania japonica]|uniref:Uncharacterized protein n=1 Tax=Stephania japonica TaxID=461633 RepID=A0AAP0K4G0_9MAGN